MMNKRQTIRLTESDLHRVIKESVNKVLNEEFGVDLEDTLRWVRKKRGDLSSQEQERFARNIISKRSKGKQNSPRQEQKYWLISLEWDSSTPYASPNFPQYTLHVYPEITEEEMERVKEDANKYSPYDYLDFKEFDKPEDFNKSLNYLLSQGAKLGK